MMDARDIVIRPIVTEKSTDLMASQNKYTFQVALKANKTQIKDAVEELFKVKVRKVNTSRVRGKLRRMGRFEGRTPDWKKAVVTLEPGHTIEVFEGL
ncbi:MAG: 50S ribosomal protein L23 [Limnochordia bacterium]